MCLVQYIFIRVCLFQMSEWLEFLPLEALNATKKTSILAIPFLLSFFLYIFIHVFVSDERVAGVSTTGSAECHKEILHFGVPV